MITNTPDSKRLEIIAQFPIEGRDNQHYCSIDEAVEDALRRAFLDINFRTMTPTKKNTTIKNDYLGKINGSRKIKRFDIESIKDQEIKNNIKEIIQRLNTKKLNYDNCNISEYLIVCLIKDGFVRRFVEYFNCNSFKTKEPFDDWHHEAAANFLNVIKKYYKNTHYGKAQKIINMMFKHLYCMNFGSKESLRVLDEKYFTDCHIPLDSFTLEWLKRQDGIAVCEWSNIEYSPAHSYPSTKYSDYVDRVNNIRSKMHGFTPFQAEFFIWPQMQITLSLESIYNLEHNKEDRIKFKNESIVNKCLEVAKIISTKKFPFEFI